MEGNFEKTRGVRNLDSTVLNSLFNYWDTVKENLINGPKLGEPTISPTVVLDGDSAILKRAIKDTVNEKMKVVLDNLESGLSEDSNLFEVLRPKILRAFNDVVRTTEQEIANYHVLKVKDSVTKVIYENKER